MKNHLLGLAGVELQIIGLSPVRNVLKYDFITNDLVTFTQRSIITSTFACLIDLFTPISVLFTPSLLVCLSLSAVSGECHKGAE